MQKSHDPTVDCFRFYTQILSFFHPFSLTLLFHPTLELGDKSTDFFQVATKEKSKVSRPGGLSNIKAQASLINIQWGIRPLHHGMVEDVEVLDVVPSPSNDIMQAKLTQGSSGGAMVCL